MRRLRCFLCVESYLLLVVSYVKLSIMLMQILLVWDN